MENQPPPEQRWRRGDRIRVAWVRVREVGENEDTLTVAYANLEDRDDVEEVKWNSVRWFTGTVRRFNPGQGGRPGSINVDFPDGTDNVSISFYDRSVHFVEPAFYEREGPPEGLGKAQALGICAGQMLAFLQQPRISPDS
jgi:hypothetical protein